MVGNTNSLDYWCFLQDQMICMKKAILNIIGIAALVAIIIIAIMGNSSDTAEKKNGFTRHYSQVTLLNECKLNKSLTSIVGLTEGSLYLKAVDPRQIIVMDKDLKIRDTINPNFPLTRVIADSYNLQVDSPFIYLFANNVATVLKYQDGLPSVNTIKLNTNIFSKSVLLSSHKIAIRVFDSSEIKQTFAIVNLGTGQIEARNPIFEGQNDGGLSTDGFLKYDSSTKSIVYLQLYRNRFFRLDTSLQLVYEGRTIDTTSSNVISVQKFSINDTMGSIMPSNPLKAINTTCFVNAGLLYIISTLKADNEDVDTFLENVPVDVYRVLDGRYLGSFYLPKYKDNKATQIVARNSVIFALYSGAIRTFEIGHAFQ